jgi:hypothetical protein
LSQPPEDQNTDRPFEAYYRDGFPVEEWKGLPIPYVHFVAPVEGDSKGDRIASVPSALLVVQGKGEWRVVRESKSGYPVSVVDEESGIAVAATLSTYGKNQRYWNALIGYDPDVGTFSIAELGARGGFSGATEVAKQGVDSQLKDRIMASADRQPFIWRVDSTDYVVCRFDGHEPWDVLSMCQLDGFRQLRQRYKRATDVIGLRFNPTPPYKRKQRKGAEGQNTEKARELNDFFKREFDHRGEDNNP